MRNTPLTALAAILAFTHPVFSEEPTTSTITGNIFKPAQLTATDERIAGLKIADGFKLSVFARDLDKPRMMAADSQGRVYVTRRGEKGDVLLLEDRDKDGATEAPRKVRHTPTGSPSGEARSFSRRFGKCIQLRCPRTEESED